jgi:hypothetical protein
MADADNYKIIIKDLALFVRNVQLSPAVRMCLVKALEKTSFKYPIRRVEVNQSFRQLSQKHVVLDVIHVATGSRIYFDFYTSDGVFTAGLFKSFDVTHSYGRT